MNAVIRSSVLRPPEIEFLGRIERNLAIVADLSRADVLMCVRVGRDIAVASQARPHSMAPIHPQDISGTRLKPEEASQIERALESGRPSSAEIERWGTRAPMVRQVHPVLGPQGRVVAAITIETNLIEHERQRRRHPVFRRALASLQKAAFSDEIPGVVELIPFGEQDGVIYVDVQRRIRYLSGIATNFYRKLGYMDPLVGRHVEYLETGDDELVGQALDEGRCLRGESKAQDREWVRQVVPVLGENERPLQWLRSRLWPNRRMGKTSGVVGAFLMVHDETEARRRERELQVKSAMIQETHHRVKNNLQTIVSLLRMEARRTTSEEARRVLEESMNRIHSISVVHEFMANQGEGKINLREVGQRLVAHMRQMANSPNHQISFTLSGPDIFVPSQQATSSALVINELLQNAAEHGLAGRDVGAVSLVLADLGDRVLIQVSDDGAGLPNDFDLHRDGSVGLNVVQVLVRDDLKGEVSLSSNAGVTATVTFPKPVER